MPIFARVPVANDATRSAARLAERHLVLVAIEMSSVPWLDKGSPNSIIPA